MMKWLNEWFGTSRTMQKPVVTRRTILGMEELQGRDLPSSHMLGAGMGMLDFHHVREGTTAMSAALRNSSSTTDSDSDSETTEAGRHGHCGAGANATFTAALSNASGATGTAAYDAAKNSLFITVKGAGASTSLDVQLDGVSIGTLTTDANGDGSLKIKNLTSAVNASSALTVGDLTGSFTQVKFSATLAGDVTSVFGSASYSSTRQDLNVKLNGLSAKTTYSILVDGTSVGTVTTNKHGLARFHLNSSALSIVAGTVLTVVDASNTTVMTGTFA